IVPLTQYGVTPQTVFFDKNQDINPRRGSLSMPHSVRNEEQRPHTITDALLDASTMIDNVPNNRRKHLRSRSQAPRDTATPTVPRHDNIRWESSLASSPMASSPGAPGSSPSSDTEQRGTGSRN